MKLQPPIVNTEGTDPYVDDLFARKDFADSLTSLFTSLNETIVLSIHAPWGDGKTTFAKMWVADLSRQDIRCIYFDAYQHDYCDDPFVAFCSELIYMIESSFTKNEVITKLKGDFRSKAKRLGLKLLTTGARLGTKALTYGILDNISMDTLEEIRKDIAEDTSTVFSNIIDEAFDNYNKSKNTIKEFQDKLSEIGTEVRKQQGFPLLIVIDELDRCRPDFALSLIERIKHLFITRNVSFVLLANMSQIENYVKTVYGADIDARTYLRKFFTVSAELPQERRDVPDNDYYRYFERLMEHHSINYRTNIREISLILFRFYNFSLRDMESYFSHLTLYYHNPQAPRIFDDWLVPFLTIIYIRYPDSFHKLFSGTLSYNGLLETTFIDHVEESGQNGSLMDRFIGLLKYLLLTDEEYNRLPTNDTARHYQGLPNLRHSKRMNLIPLMCTELMRFRFHTDDHRL